jgi:hypothetical protein
MIGVWYAMIVPMNPRSCNHTHARTHAHTHTHTHTHTQVHQLYDSIPPRCHAASPASVPPADTMRPAATDACRVIGDDILHALAAAHRASSQKRPINRPIKEHKRPTHRASISAKLGRGLQGRGAGVGWVGAGGQHVSWLEDTRSRGFRVFCALLGEGDSAQIWSVGWGRAGALWQCPSGVRSVCLGILEDGVLCEELAWSRRTF